MSDVPPLEWSHTRGRAPDFMARVTHATGLVEDVARICRDDIAQDPCRWTWSMLSIIRFAGVEKPEIPDRGRALTKDAAVAAVREAWSRESAWRAGIRSMALEERAGLPIAALRVAYGCGWAFAHEAIPLPAEARM